MAIDYDSLAVAHGGTPGAPPEAAGGVVARVAGAGATGLEMAGEALNSPLAHAVGYGAGGVGALKLGQRIFGGRGGRGAPADVTARPPAPEVAVGAPQLPSNRVVVTEELIARHPKALKEYQPGDDIARTELDKIRRVTEPGAVQSRTGASTEPMQSAKATAASRTAPKLVPSEPQKSAAEAGVKTPDVTNPAYRKATGAPMHEVDYYSESRGQFEPIDKMHISHLRNAMNKLYGKLTGTARPSPVTQKQFDSIASEVKYRAQQAGELTVPGPVGAAQTRAAVAAEDAALARVAAGSVLKGIVGGALPYIIGGDQGMKASFKQTDAAKVRKLVDGGMNEKDAHDAVYGKSA